MFWFYLGDLKRFVIPGTGERIGITSELEARNGNGHEVAREGHS